MSTDNQSVFPQFFHPLVAQWFAGKFPKPTDIQVRAWPVIAEGKHLLITAPTGSGKTLTAFLVPLDNLLTCRWPAGQVSVLYISPLKALNADMQQNLFAPLHELEALFAENKITFPRISVMTRSGDTPQSERRRISTHPPGILITTPESLNLMLSSPNTREIFTSLKMVIMDEIHAVAGSKRGTHMITAVERLVLLSGEFQRIALSATVKPLDAVADFAAGYRLETKAGGEEYIKREMKIIRSERKKKVSLVVDFPPDARELIVDNSWWPGLVAAFKKRILGNRSTLLFANTRKLSEKIASLINENESGIIAYSHHGSLSKEIRLLVEQKLKAGELKAIVATSSLELGIDIGGLDEVILVETPFSVSSALQRIGRAGHGVDETVCGTLYPIHGKDFLHAAVMAKCILEEDIEDIEPIACPLDVLAQVLISMTCMEEWDREDLYRFIRTSSPYHTLSEKQFDLVIGMLAGKYAESRIRELKSRIVYDRIGNTLRGRQGSIQLVYLAGGTIPDRGYFDLKVSGSESRIGSLDEEFVWERRVGDIFSLGTQAWKIVSIDHQKVEVIPWERKSNAIPFWKADRHTGDFHFIGRVGLFLEKWNDRIETPAFMEAIAADHRMTPHAAAELVSFLVRQKKATGELLPHRHHIIIEHCSETPATTGTRSPDSSPDAAADGQEDDAVVDKIILHTLWGGKINFPFSLVLKQVMTDQYGISPDVFSNASSIMLLLPGTFNKDMLLRIIRPGFIQPGLIENLLRKNLESTGFFGALFRENAGRALMLPKNGFGKRLPLWLTRLKSKKLFDTVMKYSDFPILLETWRTCFSDMFDLKNLKLILDELDEGKIGISEVYTTSVSPFASDLVWRQTDKYMYDDDTPESGRMSQLSDDVLKEVIANKRLRPRIGKEVIEAFLSTIQRTRPGYGPETKEELLEWIKERILIPENEYILPESSPDREQTGILLVEKAVKIRLPHAEVSAVAAIENLPRLFRALSLGPDDVGIHPLFPELKDGENRVKEIRQIIDRLMQTSPEQGVLPLFDEILAEWLRYYGPLSFDFVCSVFGIPADWLKQACAALAGRGEILLDEITEGTAVPEICDTENFERLLRLSRKKAQPVFKPLPLSRLPLFLAAWQGLLEPGIGIESLKKVLEQFFGYPGPVEILESDLFCSRIKDYSPQFLDSLFNETDLLWFGCRKGVIGFSLLKDIDLFLSPQDAEKQEEAKGLFPKGDGMRTWRKYTFWEMLDYTKLSSQQLAEAIWKEVWKGAISNESYEALRKGMLSKFKPEGITNKQSLSGLDSGTGSIGSRSVKRLGSAAGFRRWSNSRPKEGAWFRINPEAGEYDLLFYEELKKDRVRQLLLRYGIIFRELIGTELPVFAWRELFRTLYLMELSGEVLSGYFFEEIKGPQFISREAFEFLSHQPDEERIYWMNTCDPAYPYDALKSGDKTLPFRHPSVYIVFRGTKPVLIIRKKGRELEFRTDPSDTYLPQYTKVFRFLTGRKADPFNNIRVDIINNKPASKSPYAKCLVDMGFRADYNRLILRGGY